MTGEDGSLRTAASVVPAGLGRSADTDGFVSSVGVEGAEVLTDPLLSRQTSRTPWKLELWKRFIAAEQAASVP